MSQRKIPESSFSEQHDKSDDKSKKKMSNKMKTQWLIMGKLR